MLKLTFRILVKQEDFFNFGREQSHNLVEHSLECKELFDLIQFNQKEIQFIELNLAGDRVTILLNTAKNMKNDDKQIYHADEIQNLDSYCTIVEYCCTC